MTDHKRRFLCNKDVCTRAFSLADVLCWAQSLRLNAMPCSGEDGMYLKYTVNLELSERLGYSYDLRYLMVVCAVKVTAHCSGAPEHKGNHPHAPHRQVLPCISVCPPVCTASHSDCPCHSTYLLHTSGTLQPIKGAIVLLPCVQNSTVVLNTARLLLQTAVPSMPARSMTSSWRKFRRSW